MAAVKSELKQLAASGAPLSVQLTRLAGEEEGLALGGGARFGAGGGGGAEDEGGAGDSARRKSEKVCPAGMHACPATWGSLFPSVASCCAPQCWVLLCSACWGL
jgi:hypothetical protein